MKEERNKAEQQANRLASSHSTSQDKTIRKEERESAFYVSVRSSSEVSLRYVWLPVGALLVWAKQEAACWSTGRRLMWSKS